MGILTFIPQENSSTSKPKTTKNGQKHRKKTHQPMETQKQAQQNPKPKLKPNQKTQNNQSSWGQFKNLLTCKQVEGSRVHDPSKVGSSSCGSMCSFRDVVHGTTRVVHRSDNSSPESSSLGQEARLLNRVKTGSGSVSTRSLTGSVKSGASGATTHSVSSRGMPLRKLSGCYECHMIIDPSRCACF